MEAIASRYTDLVLILLEHAFAAFQERTCEQDGLFFKAG